MQKSIFLLVFLCSFLTSAYSNNKVIDYIGLGLSSQKVDNSKFDKGTALTINAGKTNAINHLGIEVEGNIQINKPKATIVGISSDLKFWSMGMYGTYLWKINDITIKPRLGFVYNSIKSSFNTSNTNKTTPINKSKMALSGGIGISYKITNSASLYTNYTKFEDDISHLTFGAEFKF